MGGISYIANVLNQKGAPAIFEDTLANRPAAGYIGRIFISTDTFVIQRDNGITWDSIGGGGGITGTGVLGQVTFWTGASAVSGDNQLFWDNANKRLGINTITPGVRLDVHGTDVIAQLNGTTTNNGYLDFQNAGVTQWRVGNTYNAAQQRFSIFNAAGTTETFTILQGGNVGINNTLPGRRLDIIDNKNSASQILLTNTDTGTAAASQILALATGNRIVSIQQYGLGVTGTVGGIAAASLSVLEGGLDSTALLINKLGAFPIVFSTNSVERMRVDSVGRVGIGYTTPAITGLAVSGSIFQGTNIANANYEMFCSGNLYTPGFAFNIQTVGINTTMTRTSCAYVCTATLTLTLPAVSGLNNQFYVIARTGATVTVQRAGSDTITDKIGTTGLTSVVVASGTRSMFYLGGGSETIQIF
jgi:hypothetical protein